MQNTRPILCDFKKPTSLYCNHICFKCCYHYYMYEFETKLLAHENVFLNGLIYIQWTQFTVCSSRNLAMTKKYFKHHNAGTAWIYWQLTRAIAICMNIWVLCCKMSHMLVVLLRPFWSQCFDYKWACCKAASVTLWLQSLKGSFLANCNKMLCLSYEIWVTLKGLLIWAYTLENSQRNSLFLNCSSEGK